MILGFKTYFPKSDKPTSFHKKIIEGTKIHSLREGNRWKAGMQIHFATGVRTKKYHQFHSGFCDGVQKISILPMLRERCTILVDGIGLNEYTKGLLATNDGFDSLDDFYEWFKKGFTGQIIHFTNYRY